MKRVLRMLPTGIRSLLSPLPPDSWRDLRVVPRDVAALWEG